MAYVIGVDCYDYSANADCERLYQRRTVGGAYVVGKVFTLVNSAAGPRKDIEERKYFVEILVCSSPYRIHSA